MEAFEEDAVSFLFGEKKRDIIEFLDHATEYFSSDGGWADAGEEGGFEGLTLHRTTSMNMDDLEPEKKNESQKTAKSTWDCRKCTFTNPMLEENCSMCNEKRPEGTLKIQLRRQRSYEVVGKPKAQNIQQSLIASVARTYNITGSAASTLLKSCGWDEEMLAKKWEDSSSKEKLLEVTLLQRVL